MLPSLSVANVGMVVTGILAYFVPEGLLLKAGAIIQV
jgi:hypothetical protein